MIKSVAFLFVLLLVIKLYSGGQCIGEWTTKCYSAWGNGIISFVDLFSKQYITIHGTYTVEKVEK